METMFCNICGMEFKDTLEMDGHKDLSHEKDPLGQDSDLIDTQDPVDSIPFQKIVDG